MDFVKLKPRKRSSVGNVLVQVVWKLMRECMVDIYMVWKRLVTLSLIWKRYGSIHVLATNYFQRILFFYLIYFFLNLDPHLFLSLYKLETICLFSFYFLFSLFFSFYLSPLNCEIWPKLLKILSSNFSTKFWLVFENIRYKYICLIKT